MDIRTAIWDARLDAKFMASYYSRKCARYQRMDRAYSIVAAFCGSAAIAAWLNEHASPAVPVFALAGIVILEISRRHSSPVDCRSPRREARL